MPGPRPEEPEILDYVSDVARLYPTRSPAGGVAEQREIYAGLCRYFDAPLPQGLAVTEAQAPHPDRPVPLRRYRRAGQQGATVIVYFHGGGFVVGGLDSHNSVCADMAAATACELVATDYRLAPEHKFPLPLTDCLAAVLAQGERPVLVAGDSAGANLAAGVALVLRDAERETPAALELLAAAGWQQDHPLPKLVGQTLIYPDLGGDTTAGSYVEMAEAPALTTENVRAYRAAHGAPAGNPYGQPLATEDCVALPPAYITVAQFDPLRDDGRIFAGRLAEAGVKVELREEPQMVHAWLRARHRSPGAGDGFRALCAASAALLHG